MYTASMPNRLTRRRALAQAPRAIRMQARAKRQEWKAPHPLEIVQYMNAAAFEEYADMDDDHKAAIYNATKNMLKRKRAQCV